MKRGPSRFLLALGAVSLALLFVLAVVIDRGDVQSRHELERNFRQRAEIASQLIISTLQESIAQNAQIDLSRFGDKRVITNADVKAFDDNDKIPTVVAGPDGRVLASDPPTLAAHGSDASRFGPGVALALAGSPGTVTPTGPGRWSLVVALKTRFGRRVVINELPISQIDAFFTGYLTRVRTGPADNAYVVNRYGSVLGVGPDVHRPTLSRVRSGRFTLHGTPSFAANAALTGTGLQVVVTTPLSRLYAPFNGSNPWVAWSLLPAFALLVMIVLGLVYRLMRGSRALEEANRELAERNEEVVAADRMKSAFLATMSHELRTPLNGIIGFAELMHDGRVGEVSERHREYLGDILSSSNHLRRLIDDVLDLSKIEAGRLDLAPEPTDLAALVAEVCDAVRSLAERKRIVLTEQVDPAIGPLDLDPGRLKQVLFNYISNALKFTPDGGHVTITAESEPGDRFRLTVTDDGPGIAPQDLERLWTAFEQLDRQASARYGGTGLGLSLTRRLVEAQGGTVGVDTAPGRGSSFHAVLPVAVSAGEPDELELELTEA